MEHEATITMPREVGVAEAARRLGVSLHYLYSLLWDGRLSARKVGKQWRISVDAIEARLKEGRA